MIRTSILSLAFLVLMGALTNAAAPPELGVKDGFRVYTVSLRCQSRNLVGVYATAAEAFEVAGGLRAKTAPDRVEVTTGSEGKTTPTGRPALYEVYTRGCIRSQWTLQPALYTDEKKAVEAGEKAKLNVEIVRDYAPKEVFHVYGLPCRTVVGTKSRLQGSYRTVQEAFTAVEDFRTKQRLRCEVITGTKGEELLDGSPTNYRVYVRFCKSLRLERTTYDAQKAQTWVEAYRKRNPQAEIVRNYMPMKAAGGAPKVSGVFDGKKMRFPETSAEEGVKATVVLLESCHSGSGEGTAADLEAALKGDHVRLVFGEPIEVDVGNAQVRVSEIVLTLPLSTGVFWLRSGNKVLTHSKFECEKAVALATWHKKAR